MWQAGKITVDSVVRPALVKRAGETLRVETEGSLVKGQGFRAFEADWIVDKVEPRAGGVFYAVCKAARPGAVKPPFAPEYPKGAPA